MAKVKKNKNSDQAKKLSSPVICSIIIFLLGFGIYFNTITHDFTLDDDLVIGKNYLVQQGFDGIPLLFTKAYRYGFNNVNSGIYRPLTPIQFAIEKQIFGLNPKVFHFFNVIYFAITGLVLFSTLQLLFSLVLTNGERRCYGVPFIISILFIAHPVHTEVVASVKSRDEIMSLLFSLLSFYFLMRSQFSVLKKRFKQRYIHLLLSCLSFYLALISKESSITFIGIILLISITVFQQNIKQAVLLLIPYLITAGMYLLSFYFFVNKMVGSAGIAIINNSLMAAETSLERFSTKMVILGKYLMLLIFPHPLIYDYSYNHIPIAQWYDPAAIASTIVVLSLIGYAAFWMYQILKNKIILQPHHFFYTFSILFFSITLFLVSNLIIHIEATMAERFVYAPSIGFAVFSGVLLSKIFKFDLATSYSSLKKNKNLVVVIVLILSLYSYKTISRNAAWKNNFTLYSNDIKHLDNSARANYSMGSELLFSVEFVNNEISKKDTFKSAISYLKRAIEIFPKYHSAYINLSNGFNNLGLYDESIQYLNKMVEYDTSFADGFYQLGITYNQKGDKENSIISLKKCLEVRQKHLKAYQTLGSILVNKKQFDEAEGYYRKALQLFPNNATIFKNLKDLHVEKGVEYGKNGNFTAAISEFERALQINTNDYIIYSNLGIAYAQLLNYNNAIQNFEKSLKLKPNDKNTLTNLGVTYRMIADTIKANNYFSAAQKFN